VTKESSTKVESPNESHDLLTFLPLSFQGKGSSVSSAVGPITHQWPEPKEWMLDPSRAAKEPADWEEDWSSDTSEEVRVLPSISAQSPDSGLMY
jgi:hypothetical protein